MDTGAAHPLLEIARCRNLNAPPARGPATRMEYTVTQFLASRSAHREGSCVAQSYTLLRRRLEIAYASILAPTKLKARDRPELPEHLRSQTIWRPKSWSQKGEPTELLWSGFSCIVPQLHLGGWEWVLPAQWYQVSKKCSVVGNNLNWETSVCEGILIACSDCVSCQVFCPERGLEKKKKKLKYSLITFCGLISHLPVSLHFTFFVKITGKSSFYSALCLCWKSLKWACKNSIEVVGWRF